MGESVAILFVFFILVVFGFVFYMNVMRSSAKVESEENIQLKAIGIAQKASFLPELQCSEENVRDDNCIDLYKLDAVSDEDFLKENRLYYYDIFEFSKIWVERVLPEPDEADNDWAPPDANGERRRYLYINPLPEADYKNKLSTFIPVSLYDPDDKSYGFGILVVEVYRK